MRVSVDQTGDDGQPFTIHQLLRFIPRKNVAAVTHRDDLVPLYGDRSIWQDPVFVVHRHDMAVTENCVYLAHEPPRAGCYLIIARTSFVGMGHAMATSDLVGLRTCRECHQAGSLLALELPFFPLLPWQLRHQQ